MYRRLVLLLVALPLLLVLLLPVAASASAHYNVKNRHKHVVGWVPDYGSIYNRSDHVVGFIEYDGTDPLEANIFRPGSGIPVAWVNHGKIMNLHGKVSGRVVKKNGHWVVQRRIHGHYRRRGTLPGGASSVMAAAGVRLLCWK